MTNGKCNADFFEVSPTKWDKRRNTLRYCTERRHACGSESTSQPVSGSDRESRYELGPATYWCTDIVNLSIRFVTVHFRNRHTSSDQIVCMTLERKYRAGVMNYCYLMPTHLTYYTREAMLAGTSCGPVTVCLSVCLFVCHNSQVFYQKL